MSSTAAHSRASSLNTASSETLSVEDTTGSLASGSSSTTISWIPAGLPGRILQAFGTSTVDLVTHLVIKKRLSSISSQIDLRLRDDGALSVGEAEGLGMAYHDLVELSSGSYKAKIQSKAMLLRLLMLRAIIGSRRSWLDASWYHTLHNIWAELDELASGLYEPSVQDTAHELRSLLIKKVTDELSGLWTNIRAGDLESRLAGSNIIPILCHDLAYGNGGYAVQAALDRISSSPWGASQLRKLGRQGDVLLDATRRLLVDFDNAYSRAMAFRIFGNIIHSRSSTKLGKLANLLSGPDGIGALIDDLASKANSYSPSRRTIGYSGQSIESACVALLSACCNGFVNDVVRQGLCEVLAALLEAFTRRDVIMRVYVEDEERDDCGAERDQVGVLKLLVKVLDQEDAKECMQGAGWDYLWKFQCHPNRLFSDSSLKSLINQAQGKLDPRA